MCIPFLSTPVHPTALCIRGLGEVLVVRNLGMQVTVPGRPSPPLGTPLGMSPYRWLDLSKGSPRMCVMLPTVTPAVTALHATTRVIPLRLHPLAI